MKHKLVVLFVFVFLSGAVSSFADTIVTVSFETQITDIWANTRSAPNVSDWAPTDINNYLANPIQIGDTVTGFMNYDLDTPLTSWGVYLALTNGGFSVNGNIVNVGPASADGSGNEFEVRNDLYATGLQEYSDQFVMQLAVPNQAPLPLTTFNQNIMALSFYTDYQAVPSDVLTSNLMQIMPSAGWNNIQFSWEAENDVTDIGIEGFSKNFEVSVRTSSVPEPSTIVLMTVGLAGVLIRRRKRRPQHFNVAFWKSPNSNR